MTMDQVLQADEPVAVATVEAALAPHHRRDHGVVLDAAVWITKATRR